MTQRKKNFNVTASEEVFNALFEVIAKKNEAEGFGKTIRVGDKTKYFERAFWEFVARNRDCLTDPSIIPEAFLKEE